MAPGPATTEGIKATGFSPASDGGMPGISDPGERLVLAAATAGHAVEVVPGPSAAVAGLVVSKTKVVAVAGSCQAMVPVDPKCPNVSAEHVRPNAQHHRRGRNHCS